MILRACRFWFNPNITHLSSTSPYALHSLNGYARINWDLEWSIYGEGAKRKG